MSPIIKIPFESYERFSLALKDSIPNFTSLDSFKDKKTRFLLPTLCKKNFKDEIKTLISFINDPQISIAAIDVPESAGLTQEYNALSGAAVIIGIFESIGCAVIDSVNNTPFTLHTASHTSGKLLGSVDYTPDAKLGFHNDGIISNGELSIPNHIVVYNLYIGYKTPGKFRWVPTEKWQESKKFEKTILTDDIKVKIKLTSYFYQDEQGKVHEDALGVFEIPITALSDNGERKYFLNGNLVKNSNQEYAEKIIHDIRESIATCENQIEMDQKERRAFFMKNTKGFHARDVFNDPMDGDLTRVFLRLVDSECEPYPSVKVD